MKKGDKLVWIDPDNKTSSLVTVLQDTKGSDFVLVKSENNTSEIGCFRHQLKNPVDVYCCKKCGNIDVQERAWVYSNTFTYADTVDDDSQAWCEQCDSSTVVVNLEEFLTNTENENT
jgi:hypothetical protein